MKRPSCLIAIARGARLRGLVACLPLIAAWLAPGGARACPNYGNDATYPASPCYTGTPYSTSALTLGQSGAGSVLFVQLSSDSSLSSAAVKYNGTAMTLKGSASGGNGTTTYFELWSITNPASSEILTISGYSTPTNYGWFTYGGVASIGNVSITGSYPLKAAASPGGTETFSFTPSNAGDLILEYLAMGDVAGSPGGTFSVSPLASGSADLAGPLGSQCDRGNGFAFGTNVASSASAYNITETLVSSSAFGGLCWAIDLVPSCGAATSTPTVTKTPTVTNTYTKTATPGATATFTYTFTNTYSPTVTNTPTKTATPNPAATATYTPTATNTYTKTATPNPAATATYTPTATLTAAASLGCGGPIYGGTTQLGSSYEPGVWTASTGLGLTYYGTGSSAGGSGSTMSSAGSLLIVFFLMQAASNQCVSQTYGGAAMDYLAGPVAEYNDSCSVSNDYYWWAYYVQNPANNQALVINYYNGGSPDNASIDAYCVDYGNVAATGDPIGTYSIGTVPNLGACSGSPGYVKTSPVLVTPQNAGSTMLYALPLIGNGWGYTQNYSPYPNSANTVTFTPISSYNGPYGFISGGDADYGPPDGNLANPMVATSGAGNMGLALGEYCPLTTTAFNLSAAMNTETYQEYAMLWYIEILGNGDGSSGLQYGVCGTTTETPIAGPSATNTPQPTATPTTPVPKVYQGLAANMRPYGLEYVPFPTVTTGSDTFSPLYATFTTGASPCTSPPCYSNWGAPENTARWHIVLNGLTGTVKIETRIGPDGTSCLSGVYDSGLYLTATSLTLPNYPQNDSNAYFYVGTTNTGSSATGSVANGGVPFTERFSAVGDPRFEPYADELDFSGNPNTGATDELAGGYNWFLRDLANGVDGYEDGSQDTFYANFLPSADNPDGYVQAGSSPTPGGPNYDVPKLFSLIRNGVMATNGIFTSMAGFSSYYAALGGEIGGDNNSGFKNGVPCFAGPWTSSSSATTDYVDEVVGNADTTYDTTASNVNTPSGASLVVTGTSATIGWSSLPMLGELWPDADYAGQWKGWCTCNTTWGNLNNPSNSGTAFRVALSTSNLPLGTSLTSQTGSFFASALHQAGVIGSASFFDGNNNNSSADYFSHQVVSGTYEAVEQNDGTQAATDYNVAVPTDYYDVSTPWGEDMGSTSPPEWSEAPYVNERTHLDVYAAATYTAGGISSPDDWGYYSADDANSGTDKGAGAVRALDVNLTLTTTTGNAAGGWFIVNGLAPEATTGGGFLSQFALMECVRTFADAGVPTNGACTVSPSFTNANNTYNGAGTASGKTYRIPPVPLVTILTPTASTVTQGLTTIPISWDLRYARWDGQQYDENYPCLDATVGPCTSSDLIPNPASEWHDPQAVGFNIIYSVPAGLSPTAWYSALTGSLTSAGLGNNYLAGGAGSYMADAADAILPNGTYQTSQYKYTYNWTGVAAANYLLRVECFRLPSESSTTPYPHYGYHQISINTEP